MGSAVVMECSCRPSPAGPSVRRPRRRRPPPLRSSGIGGRRSSWPRPLLAGGLGEQVGGLLGQRDRLGPVARILRLAGGLDEEAPFLAERPWSLDVVRLDPRLRVRVGPQLGPGPPRRVVDQRGRLVSVPERLGAHVKEAEVVADAVRDRRGALGAVLVEITQQGDAGQRRDVDLAAGERLLELGAPELDERDVLLRQPGLLQRAQDEARPAPAPANKRSSCRGDRQWTRPARPARWPARRWASSRTCTVRIFTSSPVNVARMGGVSPTAARVEHPGAELPRWSGGPPLMFCQSTRNGSLSMSPRALELLPAPSDHRC